MTECNKHKTSFTLKATRWRPEDFSKKDPIMKNFPTDFGEFGDPFVRETPKLLDDWYAQASGESRVLRDEFIVPNIADLKRKTIAPGERSIPYALDSAEI
jgi:hypothetical protein